MDTLGKTRWVLMGLTLMAIWAGAMAYNKIFKPECNELNRRTPERGI